MIDLDITIGTAEQQSRLARLRIDIQDKILVRVLNRTATTVRAEGAKRIKQAMKGSSIKTNQIRAFIRIDKATRGNLEAHIRPAGSLRIPLGVYAKTRETDAGIAASRGVGSIPHAFVAKMKSGHVGVFIRAPSPSDQLFTSITYRSKRAKSRGSDLPIAEIMAPGVRAVFIREEILSAMRRVAVERGREVLAQELRFRDG